MGDLELRRIPLEGVANFRSLGGYAGRGGRPTRHGVLYRSALLSGATQGDMRRIKAIGVRTVVDLRGREEVLAEPSAFAGDPQVRVYGYPLHDALDPAKLEAANRVYEQRYVNMYRLILDEKAGQAMLRKTLERVADRLGKGAVVFNCAAGKDRTGILAMLLLTIAGVEEVDIIADYQVSDTYIMHIWPELRRESHSRAVYMADTLDFLREHYGGAEKYLAAIGVSPACQNTIESALLGC